MQEQFQEILNTIQTVIGNQTISNGTMINIGAIPVILKAFQDYTKLVKEVMSLSAKDFVKKAKIDYKYGFRMPKKCSKYEDGSGISCMWACEKMIGRFGISNNTMFNDEYNYTLPDVAEFDDAFATPVLQTKNADSLPDWDGDDDERRVLQE